MSTTRVLTISKVIFALVLLLSITSCEKWVRPGKVERIISVDSWRVTSLVVNDTTMTSLFSNVRLGFGDQNSLTVLDVTGQSGSWSVGIGKKPTILYISGLLNEPYFFLNDDWEVLTCSKSRLTMQSVNGSVTNTMQLTKVEN